MLLVVCRTRLSSWQSQVSMFQFGSFGLSVAHLSTAVALELNPPSPFRQAPMLLRLHGDHRTASHVSCWTADTSPSCLRLLSREQRWQVGVPGEELT